jgi:5'-nucleotidase (lipoprotein e(P4) family)
MTRLVLFASMVATLALGACATSAVPVLAPSGAGPAGVAGDPMPLALRWYRASAEAEALFLQTYKAATAAAEGFAAEQGGAKWGVIMDADETVLDNSLYQQSRRGAPYSDSSWATWVRRAQATPTPGSVDFVRRVRALGGVVSIVTNREDQLCDATRANLQAIGLVVDQVLCKPLGSGDKNPRFQAVASGAAPSRLPPMRVVMWLGDNILDFPGLSQAVRAGGPAAFAPFGRTWFVLPNPLYGSWDRNPVP